MKRLFSNLLSLVSALIIFAFIAYGVIWIYVSKEMAKTLDKIWDNQEQYQIAIEGNQPSITGFPAPPSIVFDGNITDSNGIVYASPELIYQGFAFPSQAIIIKAPQGLDFSGPIFKFPVHLDNFSLKVRIPANFPKEFDKETLSAWQKQGGTIPIENLEIVRSSVTIKGEGYLNLDENLQPAGNISVKVSGLDDLINELVQNGTLKEKQALMAQSLVNLMSQKNSVTNESTLTTALRLQQGGIFLGPLRVASLPEWRWNDTPQQAKALETH